MHTLVCLQCQLLVHCQSNHLLSFTVLQELKKLALRRYSTYWLHEQKDFFNYWGGNRIPNRFTMHEQSSPCVTFMLRTTYQATDNQSFQYVSVIQSLWKGGCMLLLWLKTVHRFFFFFSHSIIDVASVGQLKELVCNLKARLQLWHVACNIYIYIEHEWTNIGKQVVWAKRQMLHCMSKPGAAGMV